MADSQAPAEDVEFSPFPENEGVGNVNLPSINDLKPTLDAEATDGFNPTEHPAPAHAELQEQQGNPVDSTSTPIAPQIKPHVCPHDPYPVLQDYGYQQRASFIPQPEATDCGKPDARNEARIRRDRNDAWLALSWVDCFMHHRMSECFRAFSCNGYRAMFFLKNTSYRFLVVDESHKAVLYGYKDAEAKPFMMCDLRRSDGIPSTIPWFDPCKKMGSEKYTILAMVDTIMRTRFEGRCDYDDLLRVADCLDGSPQVQGRTAKILEGRENGLEIMRAELWERVIELGVFGEADVVNLTGGLPSL